MYLASKREGAFKKHS